MVSLSLRDSGPTGLAQKGLSSEAACSAGVSHAFTNVARSSRSPPCWFTKSGKLRGEFLSLTKPLLTFNLRCHLFDEDALAGQSTPPLQAISEASNSQKFSAWEVCLQTPS